MKAYPLLPTAARARDYTESDIAELDESSTARLIRLASESADTH